MFFLIFALFMVVGCEKELVPDPILMVDYYPTNDMLYGDTLTINWQTFYANHVETNFCNSKNLKDSFSISLIESSIFSIEAFNEDGVSALKTFKVNVLPKIASTLISYKWQEIALEKYVDDGTWLDYSTSNWITEFNPEKFIINYNKDGIKIGGGPGYEWFVLNDTLNIVGSNYKIILLDEKEMILEYLVTESIFRSTYKSIPK